MGCFGVLRKRPWQTGGGRRLWFEVGVCDALAVRRQGGFGSLASLTAALPHRASVPASPASLRPNQAKEPGPTMQDNTASHSGERLPCHWQFRPRDTSAGHGAAQSDTTGHGRPQQCKACHSSRSAAPADSLSPPDQTPSVRSPYSTFEHARSGRVRHAFGEDAFAIARSSRDRRTSRTKTRVRTAAFGARSDRASGSADRSRDGWATKFLTTPPGSRNKKTN